MENVLDFINNYNPIIELFYKVLTIFLLGFGLYSLLFQKKGMQYSTIKNCIEIHRGILRSQQKLKIEANTNPDEYKILIKDHLGLITDELFYMKNGYLPEGISKNWLKNMVNFVPVSYKGKIINEEKILKSREISEYIAFDKENKGNQSKYYKDYLLLVHEGEFFNKVRKTFTIESALCASFTEPLNTGSKQVLVNYLWKKIKNRK